ncbi:hypothetical protein, partial [Klebsiella pneumoniae]|uniref:hypothetical protein n=1 Tax=Klebsiella pneumoniae TaxID=573 RepID=UPI003D2446B7
GKNSLNRLIRCVCGKKIGPDPRNFNQRVSLGRNDLLIRTFLSNLYLVLAGVCCIVNPIACLMSIVLYPLWVMNKALKFASVKFSNDNESAFENGTGRNYVGRTQSLTTLPYKEMFSEREFMSYQLEHCSDGSVNLDQPNSTCSSAMGSYGNEISISTHDINPASGLPMIENVDVAGNVYGIDRNH